MKKQRTLVAAATGILVTISGISGCNRRETVPTPLPDDPWADAPSSLVAFRDGFPSAGDPCRRLGESELTNQWLDHTRTLIGCPAVGSGSPVEQLLADRNGTLVAEVEGFSVISIPK